MIPLALSFFLVLSAHAFEMTKDVFCLDQKIVQLKQTEQNFRVEGLVPNQALLGAVSRLIEEFHVQGPLVLHFTNEVGPRKVWSLALYKEKHIYFAKNAVDLLLGLELEKIATEVCRPEWTGKKTFEVVYTNTVLEQFLRHTGSKESLAQVLEEKTGWSLRSLPSEIHFEQEQEFRTEELITIIKQLVDLPASVFKQMKLKKITRWRHGAPLPIPEAKAIYFENEQKIIYGDGALMDESADMFGEGTVLHELGHAYWFGVKTDLKEKFTGLSWTKSKDNWVMKNDSGVGFVTSYAMTSPEEDFADHFSAYVNRPEWLKRKALKKHEFFHSAVFTDSTYFTTVAKNAKVKIDSPIPDTKDPWLLGDLAQSYKVKTVVLDPKTKIAEINVEIAGAVDDISGIAPTLFTYEHIENDNFKVFVNLVPELQPDGSSTLKAKVLTDPKKLAPGQYRPNTLNLQDKAGNNQFYATKALANLELPGFLSLNQIEKDVLDPYQIKIEQAPIIQGYSGLIVTLPIPLRENLEIIHLKWEFKDLEGKTVNVCMNNRRVAKNEIPCFIGQEVGKPIKIQSYFYKEYPSSLVKLASMTLRYKASETATKTDHDFIIPVNVSNASATITTGNSILQRLDLDVNKMKLSAVSQANEEGGDQNIEVMVPLQNRPAGQFNLLTTIRSPTGKQILHIVRENSPTKKFEIVNIDGVDFVKFLVALKKNPEDGEYMIEGFELKTDYERPRNPYLPLDHNGLSVNKIKLIERGIRKSFTITNDKITQLH